VSASKDKVSWTAFGREWIVDLELSDITEDNTDYYHGTLEGDASAVVSFTLLPGLGLSGMIATGAKTWWIRAMPIAENAYSEDENDVGIFMIVEQASFAGMMNSNLATPLQDESAPASVPHALCSSAASTSEADVSAPAPAKKRTISSYKVGVLFDQKWALASNNPWASQANTLGLFNDVNAIYKAQGLAQFSVQYLKQLTNSYTTLNDMLTYFSGTASSSIAAMSDTSYTNYVWLIGTNVGGLAYVGTTCKGTGSAQNKKTAVIGLVNYSRLWTVKTIAHEMGHNRGANHVFTDQCSSTVTTDCQCSIMSYCFPSATNNPDGAVNVFADFTIDEMHTAGCY